MQVLHTFSKSGQIQTVCLRNGSPEIWVYSAEHVFLLSQYDSQCLQYTWLYGQCAGVWYTWLCGQCAGVWYTRLYGLCAGAVDYTACVQVWYTQLYSLCAEMWYPWLYSLHAGVRYPWSYSLHAKWIQWPVCCYREDGRGRGRSRQDLHQKRSKAEACPAPEPGAIPAARPGTSPVCVTRRSVSNHWNSGVGWAQRGEGEHDRRQQGWGGCRGGRRESVTWSASK